MRDKLEYLIYFVLLVLLQVLILNNIQIGGLVNPYLYILFILILPIQINPYILMLLGFVLGFSINIFTNTWGINAAATTLVAYLRPYLLKLFCSQEDLDKTIPNLRNLGRHFIPYILSAVFIHNLTLFALEAFSFQYIGMVLAKTIINTLITSLLILAIQSFTLKK